MYTKNDIKTYEIVWKNLDQLLRLSGSWIATNRKVNDEKKIADMNIR